MGHQWAAIKKEMNAIGEDGSFAEGALAVAGPKTPSKRGGEKSKLESTQHSFHDRMLMLSSQRWLRQEEQDDQEEGSSGRGGQ